MRAARNRARAAIGNRILLALICCPALLVVAFQWAHSTGEFLVLGLGPALLLDRYLFRLLPWTYPLWWRSELFLRGAYVGLGGVGYSLVRAGVIRAEEAFSLGLALSLAAFLFECVLCLGARGAKRVVLWLRPMPNDQSPMTKECPSPNDQASAPRRLWLGWRKRSALGFRHWSFFGHWCLAIGHSSGKSTAWTPLQHLLFFCPVVVLTLPLFALHMPRTIPAATPAGLHLPYEDVHFQTRDGLELGGWLIPHAQARGTIIFCHGHGQNRGQVLGCLQTLHELRLNVLAFDFRGHGDSPGHTETFGLREVNDLVAADAYVRLRFPQQPVFLMGVSYGAAVMLQALPLLPPVQAVWSESCFSNFDTVLESNFSWLPAELRRPLVAAYRLLAWVDCGFWENEITPVHSIENLRVPICFCHGMADELVPFADGKTLYQAYAGPKWHYWVKNAGHNNLQQSASAEYGRRLHTFFANMLDQSVVRGP